MVFRRHLIEILSRELRSVSSLARELGSPRATLEDDLRHAIRSARAQGHDLLVVPAQCKSCGFLFSEDKLTKPSRWLHEPMIGLQTTGE